MVEKIEPVIKHSVLFSCTFSYHLHNAVFLKYWGGRGEIFSNPIQKNDGDVDHNHKMDGRLTDGRSPHPLG